ncbi:MAG: hypothetical protein CSA52_02390 [Gammaproteobacteria bacterium]|nr:MAG: hypothetical protein CSA52_02390 [Gammaproteobacteria bacterium]
MQGNCNNLSSTAFAFDLDGDGVEEQLSFAGKGSGFLVLDKNRDGRINNGSEMFGPTTGNGFNELADYDEDGNGFIDAGDAVFNQLKIWTRDEPGNDRLLSLKQAGIAAIGVTGGHSPFSVKDHYNNEYGQVQRTGITLSESGAVGSVQQINLSHRDLDAEQVLQNEFDKGEKSMAQQQTVAKNNTDALTNPGDESLETVLSRLDAVTQAMLNGQDKLAHLKDNGNTPRSLVEQIMAGLEEARIARQQKTG